MAESFPRFCSSSKAFRKTKYAKYIKDAIAELFSFGSFGQGSPQVILAHSIPLRSPKIQKMTPTFTDSTAIKSSSTFPELKYLILYITEIKYIKSIANHIGTW